MNCRLTYKVLVDGVAHYYDSEEQIKTCPKLKNRLRSSQVRLYYSEVYTDEYGEEETTGWTEDWADIVPPGGW